MLERLLEMRWPVTAVLSDDSVTKRSDWYLDLTTEQWTLAEELIKILQPFDVATTIGVGMGGAGGAAAPPTFQQEGLSPPNVHMLSLLFNVEPPNF